MINKWPIYLVSSFVHSSSSSLLITIPSHQSHSSPLLFSFSLSFTNILPPLEKRRDFMQFRVDRRRESTDSEWEGRGRSEERGEEGSIHSSSLLFSRCISDSRPFDLPLRQYTHGILSFSLFLRPIHS